MGWRIKEEVGNEMKEQQKAKAKRDAGSNTRGRGWGE